MRKSNVLLFLLLASGSLLAQKPKKTIKYPSVLWEISSPKTAKKSYLFGTYHISRKNVFHLSDSFYIAIKNCDVVATESLESTWEEEFFRQSASQPDDLGDIREWRGACNSERLSGFDMGTFSYENYEKELEQKFDEIPNIIKSIISRVYSEDFSEDTYLDHYIYKLGLRMNKLSIGLENFRESEDLVLQASIDRAIDPRDEGYYNRSRIDPDEIFDAYIRNDLDVLDSLGALRDNSEPYREKMLYARNYIQARAIDSFIRINKNIFAAVGCAHLPGQKGVIEILRGMGYTMRPVIATQKTEGTNNKYKDMVVKRNFSRQTTPDGIISVKTPGKLYSFIKKTYEEFYQSVDVDNDAYFLITRLKTNYRLHGDNDAKVLKKLDSLFYDNIPGDILEKKPIERFGYKGYEVLSKKKSGIFQKYQLIVTPLEILYFKSYSSEAYLRKSGLVDTFFNSITLTPPPVAAKVNYTPKPYGGFSVNLPHEPVAVKDFSQRHSRYEYYANDKENDYTVLRGFRFDSDFGGIDSIDLEMMRISYGDSYFIDTVTDKHYVVENGRPSLYASFRHKNNTVSKTRFLLRGNEFYALIAHSAAENPAMDAFLRSFRFTPYQLPEGRLQQDTFFNFKLKTPIFYDSVSQVRRKSAQYWIDYYKGNKDFAKELNERDRDDDGIILNDSIGVRIEFDMRASLSSYSRKASARADYAAALKKDTARITKTEYSALLQALSGAFTIRKIGSQIRENGMVEKTIEAGWPGSSRIALVKIMNLPGTDRYMTAQYQRDSLDAWPQLDEAITSFTLLDKSKLKPALSLDSLLFRLEKNDTTLTKEMLENLGDSLETLSEVHYPAVMRTLQRMKPGIKNYLQLKSSMLYGLARINKPGTADFLYNYFRAQEDTLAFQQASLLSLFGLGTKEGLQKGMLLLMDNPDGDYAGEGDLFRAHMESKYEKLHPNEFANSTRREVAEIDKRVFADLAEYAGDIASLMYEPDWKSSVIRTLSILQEAGMLKKSVLQKYEKKLMQYARKELRNARQADMERVTTAPPKMSDDNEDDDEVDYRDYGSDNDKNPGNARLFTELYRLLKALDENTAGQLLAQTWQLHNENGFKQNMLSIAMQRKLPFPDTLVSSYLKKENEAFSFINERWDDDSINLVDQYKISDSTLVKYILKGGNSRYNSRGNVDSFVLVDRKVLVQADSVHTLYFCKTYQKKDKKNFNWAVCKLTRSAKTGSLLIPQIHRAYTTNKKMYPPLSLQDLEQLYFQFLFAGYEPLERFFEDSKAYTDFSFSDND